MYSCECSNPGYRCECSDADYLEKVHKALFWFNMAGPDNVDEMTKLIKKALDIKTDD